VIASILPIPRHETVWEFGDHSPCSPSTASTIARRNYSINRRLGWRLRGTRRKGNDIDKHHRNFCSVPPVGSCLNISSLFAPNVSAERAPQFFFFAQSGYHPFELTDHAPNSSARRNGPARRADCVTADTRASPPAATGDRSRARKTMRAGRHADKDAEQLWIGSGRRWRKSNSSSDPIDK
jgi:hypothetical protein